jgi:aminoglycoside phosphotransferase (APT) family kinase protein
MSSENGDQMTTVDDHAVDQHKLELWMDRQGLGSGHIGEVQALSGGTQNILLIFTRDEQRYVLRRPAVNPRRGSNEIIRREARVLRALKTTAVPHPRLIAACEDEAVLGAAFYLMEPIEGFNATVGLPALHAANPGIRRLMGFALVDGAAAIGQVDHTEIGLGDFGKTDSYLERQVERWRSQLRSYESYAGWPGPQGLPGVAQIEAYLQARWPRTFRPGLMHGDYSIGNVLYRNDGPGLAAIVDWELATIGDPLIDLAWIVATWRGAGGPDLPVLRVEPFDGFPGADEMIAHYAARVDRDLSSIDWYVVLACYKLAILLEGTFARACAGVAGMETGMELHETSLKLLERARHRIG